MAKVFLPRCKKCKKNFNKSTIMEAMFTKCEQLFCLECYQQDKTCHNGCHSEQEEHVLLRVPFSVLYGTFSNFTCKYCEEQNLDLDHACKQQRFIDKYYTKKLKLIQREKTLTQREAEFVQKLIQRREYDVQTETETKQQKRHEEFGLFNFKNKKKKVIEPKKDEILNTEIRSKKRGFIVCDFIHSQDLDNFFVRRDPLRGVECSKIQELFQKFLESKNEELFSFPDFISTYYGKIQSQMKVCVHCRNYYSQKDGICSCCNKKADKTTATILIGYYLEPKEKK